MEVWQDDRKFQVLVDVSQYSPQEISIEADNSEVIIHASHEERSDQHGYITRSFRRRVELPPDVNSNSITSYVTPEGYVCITAPKGPSEATKERVIPIYPSKHHQWGHHGHHRHHGHRRHHPHHQQRVQVIHPQQAHDRTTPAA